MVHAIAVIGAGAVGLHSAIELLKSGWDVTVIEEHGEVGKPVQCAGLISKSGAEMLHLPIEECIVNEVRGAKLFAPNGEILRIEKNKSVACVLDRAKLDKTLYAEARKHNAKIMLNTSLIDIRNEMLFIKHESRGEMLKAKIVIGADGANSNVRKILGINVASENLLHAYQVTAKGSFEKDFVQLHFGNFAPGFFAWVVPESAETARIGIACSGNKNPNEALQEFMGKANLQISDVHSRLAGLIPVGPPLKENLKGNVLLAGDCALQTKATTGGGIITGCIASLALNKTVSEHLKNNAPLANYSGNLSALNKELAMHWKLRNYFNSLNENDINALFAKLKKARAEEFLSLHGDMDMPSKFLPKLLRTPSLWGLALKLAIK